jgi:hypothetical protein
MLSSTFKGTRSVKTGLLSLRNRGRAGATAMQKYLWVLLFILTVALASVFGQDIEAPGRGASRPEAGGRFVTGRSYFQHL